MVVRQGLGEPRLIPSESMVPTLQVDDRVLVEKPSQWFRSYQRGDILVFYPPQTELKNDPWSLFLRWTGFSGLYPKEANVDVAYIKRLIGLPGERLEVKFGQGVFINGHRLAEPYVADVPYSCTRELPTTQCGALTIPPNHYFVMGDNRNGSLDSRYWGFLPKERVIGRAWARVWPLDRFDWLDPHYNEAPTRHDADSF
jgi:signal peptidase I